MESLGLWEYGLERVVVVPEYMSVDYYYYHYYYYYYY